MPKKLIIAVSAGAVVIAIVVFGVVLLRSRALTDEAPIDVGAPSTPGEASPGGGLGSSSGQGSPAVPAVPQGGPCGDGTCSEGESWCKPDCGSEEERFLGSIVATDVTPTSLGISWKTSKPATAEVSYGRTENYELGVLRASAPAEEQSVSISGLSPGTTYFIRIRATDADGKTWEAGQLAYETTGR